MLAQKPDRRLPPPLNSRTEFVPTTSSPIYDLLSTIYSNQPMMSLSRPAKIPARTLACLAFLFAAIVIPAFTHRVVPTLAILGRSASAQADTRLSGDYDYYVMLGAAPNGGFEARRRMGFAHFDGPSANGAWFKRRSGAPLYAITKVTVAGAQMTMSLENGSEIVAALKGDDIEGRIYREGKPIDRIWLVKRTDPITWEANYALWS